MIKQVLKQTVLLLLCLACLLYSLPAQAATLEEKVLQIIRNNPEVIIESVQAYQLQQQQLVEKRRQAFLEELKTNPKAVI
ncbi:MAG: disulfide bond formation protein DsbA, partial [Symploca sp. SIO1B1]|nr:disulfide bond formation protein DsbA [Symploca sp. SIO1B1]